MAPPPSADHLHFAPTSASWLNLVERWFARDGTFLAFANAAARSAGPLMRAPDDPDRYGVSPDVQRLLLLTMAEGEKGTAATPPMTVVLNYAQGLKR